MTTDPFASVAASPAPAKTNNRLKVGIIVAAVIVALAIIGAVAGSGSKHSTPAPTSNGGGTSTQSVGSQFGDWAASFRPVWSQTQADWNTTYAAVSNNDVQGATNGFSALGQDAATIATYENSPDPVANGEVAAIAQDLINLSSDGVTAVNGGDVTAFGNDAHTLANDETALTNTLTADSKSF